MIAEGWLVVYMDHLLIFSNDKETHWLWTLCVLQQMRELPLSLKIEKCHSNLPEVEYLEMIVRKNTVAMDPVKVKGITDWPTPFKVRDVRSFLSFANFYWRFIPGYSNITQPLIDLTKKNAPWEWSPKCKQAFDILKKIFCMEPALKMPDPSAPFSITTNASKHTTGGVLMQQNTNRGWKPCTFLFQSLNPAEWNYDIYDKELLAVICALKEWRHYLHGSPYPVKVQTDHKNLTYLKQPQNLNHCQAQWLLDLADFDLELHHVPGKDLGAPNALSRQLDHSSGDDSDNEQVTLLPKSLFVGLIDSSLAKKIALSSEINPMVLTALQAIDGKMPLPFKSRLTDWTYKGGILSYKDWVYIPDHLDLCCATVAKHHDHPTARHPGILKTCQLMATEFWWPGLPMFVWKYVKGCSICQQNKVQHPSHHPTLCTHPILNFLPLPTGLLWPYHRSPYLLEIWFCIDHGRPWPYKGGNFLPNYKDCHHCRHHHSLL